MDGAKPQVAPVRKVTEQKLTKANFSYPLLIEHYTKPPLGCKPQARQIIYGKLASPVLDHTLDIIIDLALVG